MTFIKDTSGGRFFWALAVFTAFIVLATSLPRAEETSFPDSEKQMLLDQLVTMIQGKYAYPEKGLEVSKALKSHFENGGFAGIKTEADFAAQVTAFLKPYDQHFSVKWSPPLEEAEKAGVEINQPGKETNNYGFDEFRLLSGNIAYLDIYKFALIDLEDSTDPARKAAEAAMGMLASADAIIIDLRESGGGTPEMVQLILSYFFDETPRLLNKLYWGLDGQTYEFWTLENINGKRLSDIPLFVLTSGRTGSASEEFAYDVKVYERGLIIGERTLGAANPGSVFSLGDGFTVFISVGSVTNGVTGKNWEGTGVTPDFETTYEDALQAAHRIALETVLKTTDDPAIRTGIIWTLERMEAEAHPELFQSRNFESFTGNYGTRQVILGENGKLTYRVSDRRPLRILIPLGEGLFAIEGFDRTRLEFETDSNGTVIALIEKSYTGATSRVLKNSENQ